MNMDTGIVKFLIIDKGFGFITDDETKQDFYFHVSGVNGDVVDGDKVKFEVVESPKGLKAIDISKL